MIEGEIALYAMRRRYPQPLAAVRQRMLEVPEVLGDVALGNRRLFGDLLRGQLARAEQLGDALAHSVGFEMRVPVTFVRRSHAFIIRKPLRSTRFSEPVHRHVSAVSVLT